MKISFRKLVSILEIDVPIHFTPEDELKRDNYVFCRFMGEAEKEAVLSGTHELGIIYNENDVGLHLPDIDIERYYELEKGRNPVAIRSVISAISYRMRVCISEIPLVYSIYCILHEYGHWLFFQNSGMTSYDYCKSEAEIREKYVPLNKKILNMPDCDPSKYLLAREFHEKIYSQFPSELAANKYALENIEKSMKKTRDYLGYTELDLLHGNS